MNWIIDHIDQVVTYGIPALVLVAVGIIALGCMFEQRPSMMHENEPQGERRWRSSKEKSETIS